MQAKQEYQGMRRVYGIVKAQPTEGEQNLAAALLDVLMHQTNAAKAKKQRRKKTA